MWMCIHCGHEFDEPHQEYDKGTGRYDYDCPNCGSEDIEEALICDECGAVKSADEIVNGMCADCINIAAEDMRQAYEYGADRTEVIELNGVLAMAFSKVQIEAILTNYLMNNGDFAAECKKFALDDKFDFTDWLAERRKK
mgnify:CR=1 FL=1